MSISIPWTDIQARYDQINKSLVDPSLDNNQRSELQKEHSKLSTLLKQKKTIDDFETALNQCKLEMESTIDEELKKLFEEEFYQLETNLNNAKVALDDILFPPDEHNSRSVYLEIRAGTGGQEAALFVSDLLKMYTNYALKKGWKVCVEDSSHTDIGGFKEIVLFIQGKDVYKHLKRESGVHRVQRVPQTETSGRIHTSTATIAVLPEAKEVDMTINPDDLKIDVYRAGGAGGQHVNKTESAVRITHIPTGVVVTCQEERSQHKNKAKAMKMLQSRLLASQIEKQDAELSAQRKEQVGTGMRSEKVRTYNYPQNRVTDHQVDLTLNKLDYIVMGDMDEIIQALMLDDAKKRRSNAFSL